MEHCWSTVVVEYSGSELEIGVSCPIWILKSILDPINRSYARKIILRPLVLSDWSIDRLIDWLIDDGLSVTESEVFFETGFPADIVTKTMT